MTILWGIDLGGTKTEAVVLESSSLLNPIARQRIPTEAEQGYEHIIAQMAKLVAMLAKQVGQFPNVVGVGHPGAEDPLSGQLKNSNTGCLNGRTLRRDLAAALDCPVIMANDANCFALAESRFGAATGAEVVFGVIMGTGVGGGIVVNGRVLGGMQGIAGEWGHNILLDNGPACYCGKRGCVETVISGPALQKYYYSLSNSNLRLEEIFSENRLASDKHAQATQERLLTHFGKAIAVVINILDPACIVLGGGLSNIKELYSSGREHAKRYIFNNRFDTPIVQNQLGDSAGVYGAAFLTEA